MQEQWTSVTILTLALDETHLFHSHLGSRLKVACCVCSASVLLILAVFL